MTFLPAEEENHLRNEQIYIFFLCCCFVTVKNVIQKLEETFLMWWKEKKFTN
jgi:hypothetical protein